MPASPLLAFPLLSTRSRFDAERPFTARPPAALAADLHLHSPYAGATSKAMTLENILVWARRKGLDLLGTGDCLQADRLREIDATLEETASGLLVPRPECDDACHETIPERLYRPLHFVLSTEVCCAGSGRTKFDGLHHLIYFRSLESAHRFRDRIARFGDLQEGRPTLRLSSLELLALVLEHGDGTELAPAHVLSPWYSLLGSKSGKSAPRLVFGDLTSHLLGCEVGGSSTLPMCRRISGLDPHTLFCCSDAHSLEHLGREYTLLDIEPGYDALMRALRDATSSAVRGYVKFPVERSGYYYNYCSRCEDVFAQHLCPQCGSPLAIGTRERLEQIADRPEARLSADTPPTQHLLPLADLIAGYAESCAKTKGVTGLYASLIGQLGHERHILRDATRDELRDVLGAGNLLAEAIVRQRTGPFHFPPIAPNPVPPPENGQFSWDF